MFRVCFDAARDTSLLQSEDDTLQVEEHAVYGPCKVNNSESDSGFHQVLYRSDHCANVKHATLQSETRGRDRQSEGAT